MASVKEFLCEWRSESPHVIAHTSGSTGRPKEIRLLKSDMLQSARATNRFFGIDENSVLAIPLSMDYIAGKMMVVRAEEAGCRLLEMPVSNRVELSEKVDLISLVPSQLEHYMLYPMAKHVLLGGAPLRKSQELAIVESGIDAWLGYGMTETCSHVALRKVGDDGVFRAMDGISFSTDKRDCLVVCSDDFSWMRLVTNDVVELIDSHSFRWLGRADNVINSGGIKLHPEQLESELRDAFPWLPPFYLKGEDDESLGQRLVMVAENPSGDILNRMRQSAFDHRRLPKKIIAVKAFKRTSNGKLIRE